MMLGRRQMIVLYVLTAALVLLLAVAAYLTATRGEDEEKVIAELRTQLVEHRRRDQEHLCTAAIDHRSTYDALAAIAAMHGKDIDPPRFMISEEIRKACRDAGIGVSDAPR